MLHRLDQSFDKQKLDEVNNILRDKEIPYTIIGEIRQLKIGKNMQISINQRLTEKI